MLITLAVIAVSIVYSLIFVAVSNLFKSSDIYARTSKSLKSLKEYSKIGNITPNQVHELISDYKAIFKKEIEIYSVSLVLFVLFYYYIVPVFIGVNYKLSFLVLSIVFSIAISIGLYVVNKKIKKKQTNIKV